MVGITSVSFLPRCLVALLFGCFYCRNTLGVFNSQSNYNAYHYDMTTPQFTPDGRLLQVEYASIASTQNSAPCLIWAISDHLKLFIVLPATIPSGGKTAATTSSNPRSTSQRPQNRIIVLSDDIVVVLSGILSDALALMQIVYQEQENTARAYGSPFQSTNQCLTPIQIVNAVADACQQHSIGGGVRPYGATVLVSSSKNNQMLQTDPSGAIWNVNINQDSDHPNGQSSLNFYFLGGTHDQHTGWRRWIEKSLANQPEREDPITIPDALRILLKSEVGSANKHAEVVIQSKQLGAHRLTPEHLEQILTQTSI